MLRKNQYFFRKTNVFTKTDCQGVDFMEIFERERVLKYGITHCGNYGILLPRFFRKIPSNQLFTKEVYSKLL